MAFVTDFVRAQFQAVIKDKVRVIVQEEAEKAGREVAKRVLELAAETSIIIERNATDYMMENNIKIHVHIPSPTP